MSVIVIPNISAGSDLALVQQLAETVRTNHARVLDVHSDPIHQRSVLTVAGETAQEVDAMVALSGAAAERIDLTSHRGIHPRFGCLDVCPFVPLSTEMDEAVEAARDTAHRIARDLEIPVFLYGSAASPGRPNELPDVRRAIAGGLDPDLGPPPEPRTGVVCVGARDVLIAFNVWVRCEIATARQIATAIRARDGGLQGVRALGLELEPHMCQISTNITLPEACGIDEVYSAISSLATRSRVEVTATEIVGLVPERFLPNPDEEAARRLMSPGRSLESVLAL